MGLGALVVGMGSREAAEFALRRTRKHFADKKAKAAKERKAAAEKAADTYQPPTQEKKPPKKKEGVVKDVKDTVSNIRKRQQALEEASGDK